MFGFDIQFPVNEELTVAQDFLWKHKLELFTDHFYYQLNTILKKMYKHFLLCWFIESTLIPTVHQLHISVIFVVLLHQGAEAAVILMFSLLTPFFSFPAADPSELCPAHHGKNFKIWLKLNCNLS